MNNSVVAKNNFKGKYFQGSVSISDPIEILSVKLNGLMVAIQT